MRVHGFTIMIYYSKFAKHQKWNTVPGVYKIHVMFCVGIMLYPSGRTMQLSPEPRQGSRLQKIYRSWSMVVAEGHISSWGSLIDHSRQNEVFYMTTQLGSDLKNACWSMFVNRPFFPYNTKLILNGEDYVFPSHWGWYKWVMGNVGRTREIWQPVLFTKEPR